MDLNKKKIKGILSVSYTHLDHDLHSLAQRKMKNPAISATAPVAITVRKWKRTVQFSVILGAQGGRLTWACHVFCRLAQSVKLRAGLKAG